jgi:hypothetical protein
LSFLCNSGEEQEGRANKTFNTYCEETMFKQKSAIKSWHSTGFKIYAKLIFF